MDLANYPRVIDPSEALPLYDMPPKLVALNDALEPHGFHQLSPWWERQVAAVYASNKRQAVFRCGRRAGKSSTVCRIAVYEALFGEHNVPPGDIGIFGIISADKVQAKDRLNTIRAIFEALDIGGVKIMGEQIVIESRRVAIRIYAASLRGVVGCTSIGWILDEMTRWRDSDTGANPAAEIVRSLAPTMITMPNARMWWISSPYSTMDIHYEAVEKGITERQHVGIAPTWIANPTLTFEDTLALESDIGVHAREYGAIPSSGDENAFFNRQIIEEARVPFLEREGGDGLLARGYRSPVDAFFDTIAI